MTKVEKVEKLDGVTDSEKFLKKLCDRTFLSMWSYPNIHRDQGKEKRGEGKEVCDLLIVFENHIIIFSDKHCKFPDSGNLVTDWNRWFKKAILKSAEQAWGAERWIKSFPKRLFLDRECSKRFPISLPTIDNAIFHLVIVAHDSGEICKQVFNGGSGSLMINSNITGSHHFIDKEGEGLPFTIGDLDPSKTFVHVLDDFSVITVLSALDTISDFVAYLVKKEKLIRADISILASGEEELLTFYLKNLNENGEHDFTLPTNIGSIVLAEGGWEEYCQSLQRQAQLDANQISYSWDALIEKSTYHAFTGTHYYSTHPGVENSEKIYRFLARESRTRRRLLARSLTEFLKNTPINYRATRVMLPSKPGDPHYIFLALPRIHNRSNSQYRKVRLELLESYCAVTKLQFPAARNIIGIATEPGYYGDDRSEDIAYFDASIWTEEDNAKAESLRNELVSLGMLAEPTIHVTKEYEYPPLTQKIPRSTTEHFSKKKGTQRNKLCPCGSGKKYKYCHGR